MPDHPDAIIFQTHPDVVLAKQTFRGIPKLLVVEDNPIIEVIRNVTNEYSFRVPIYHSDGTKFAVMVGPRIFLTEEGRKANINRRNLPDLTVLEFEGKPIIELRRTGPASLKGQAELFAQAGIFVKVNDTEIAKTVDEQTLTHGGTFQDNTFNGGPYGFSIKGDTVSLAGMFRWKMGDPPGTVTLG